MTAPDVSVVVAVYNTMPYLTECLTSLVEQTIGADRLEIVAVDDGSTDGSGAGAGPVRRALPGAPSRSSTRPTPVARRRRATAAWTLATGRYVFFIGSDDHLGPEALERLVDAADRWDSDVVLGRMVGVNGRLRLPGRSSPDNAAGRRPLRLAPCPGRCRTPSCSAGS